MQRRTKGRGNGPNRITYMDWRLVSPHGNVATLRLSKEERTYILEVYNTDKSERLSAVAATRLLRYMRGRLTGKRWPVEDVQFIKAIVDCVTNIYDGLK